MIKIILTSIICLFAVGTVRADSQPFRFEFANDYFAPGGRDRWLTNQMSLHYGEWGIGNEMYTPTVKTSEEIPYGDRNWDGYSYLERVSHNQIRRGQFWDLTTRVGILGNASGAPELQQWMHDDLGFGTHPTWATTNPDEPAIDVIAQRFNRTYPQSLFGDSKLEESYGIRLGNVKDLIFLDQQLTKHFGKYTYVFAGLRGEAIAYNTFLDGRLFQDNVHTIDKNWFLASGRLGVKFSYGTKFIQYAYKYLTEEFKGQTGRHLYGTIEFGFDF